MVQKRQNNPEDIKELISKQLPAPQTPGGKNSGSLPVTAQSNFSPSLSRDSDNSVSTSTTEIHLETPTMSEQCPFDPHERIDILQNQLSLLEQGCSNADKDNLANLREELTSLQQQQRETALKPNMAAGTTSEGISIAFKPNFFQEVGTGMLLPGYENSNVTQNLINGMMKSGQECSQCSWVSPLNFFMISWRKRRNRYKKIMHSWLLNSRTANHARLI